jgi:hypothetical protein
MPGVYASTPPTKWIIAVAVTAVASFAAGLLIATVSGVQVQMGDNASAASAPPVEAPVAKSPVAKSPVDQPAPPSEPTKEAKPDPDAADSAATDPEAVDPDAADPEAVDPDAAADPEAADPEADPDAGSLQPSPSAVDKARADAKNLPHGVGMFLVRTSQPDAWVYVSGRPYSKAGVPFQVVCGPHHVRLGDANRSTWFEPGQSMTLACRELTDVTIEPRPAPPAQGRMVWPPTNYPKGQFLK